KLVDPRTKKAHMIKKEIPARNFLDVGKSLSKVATTIDLPEALHQKMDIPEDPIDLPEAPLPEIDISEDPIQKDSSNDDSVVSLYEEFYSFINFEDEELTDQEIDFNSPETLYKNIEMLIEPIDPNKGFVWIILWVLKYQKRHRKSEVETSSLVKFLRYVLVLENKEKYSSFPTSLKMAHKALGVCVHMIKYAT
ncbi:5234_t:CDS:2, partial [Gigaspora rosea]